MDKDTKKRLSEIMEDLEALLEEIESVRDDEQDLLDCMNEKDNNFDETDMAVQDLTTAADCIEEAIGFVETICDR